jgi:general stress protein YciG
VEDSPKTQTEWLKLAAISAIDLVPGGKALKLLKGAAGKVAMKKMEKQLLKEARKAAKRMRKVAKQTKKNEKLAKEAGKKGGKTMRQAGNYIPAPKNPTDMPAFPNLRRVKEKTSKGAGKLRERWKDEKGNIYEWDSQHGTLEKYNKRGNHLGEFDKDTGKQLKPADPIRKVEP